MGWAWAVAVLVVLVVGLVAVPARKQVKFLIAPFLVPAWLAIVGAIAQATTNAADCYEECGYVWIYLYAVFTLIVAAVVALVIAVTLAVLHRRTSASD